MEGACSKRKPATQLTKDAVEGGEASRELGAADAEAAGEELRAADPETLKSRRRLKIVRTHAPAASLLGAEPEALGSKGGALAPTAAAAPELKEPTAAPAASAAPAAAAAPAAGDSKPEAAPSVGGGGDKNAAATAAAPAAAAAAPEAALPNGDAAQDSSSSNSSSSSSSGGGGLFGSVLKGTPAFVSPFGSLSGTGSSFLLPSASTAAGGPSLFGGPPGAPSADAEEADVSPPEEPTIVATSVDSKEEVVFSDRDCRMQCFDAANKVWTPKPPLEGKLDFVVPKKGEEEGLPIARLLFFVNRTGRLRLNSPVLPSSVPFRHPPERVPSAAAAKAAAGAPAAAAAAAGPAADTATSQKKELPLKLNTVEFTGLKIDAKDSKDTTFFRIRFSSEEKAKAFMTLANEKQEEATKAAQNGSK
ncbi:hypothetical protein Efla_004461 [Eimeria flavescens]